MGIRESFMLSSHGIAILVLQQFSLSSSNMGTWELSPDFTTKNPPGSCSLPGHGCISDTKLDTGVAGQGCEEAAKGSGGCGVRWSRVKWGCLDWSFLRSKAITLFVGSIILTLHPMIQNLIRFDQRIAFTSTRAVLLWILVVSSMSGTKHLPHGESQQTDVFLCEGVEEFAKPCQQGKQHRPSVPWT